jgi:hypothetical protein
VESSFEDAKTIHEERFGAETGRNRSEHFFTLNDDCSAQDRPRDPKLVSLELSV